MGKQFSKCASAPYCGSDKIDALSDMDEKEPCVKIVFCSCNEETTKRQPLWNIMKQANADAYIFLGDMIYMDLKVMGGGLLAKPKVNLTFEQRYNMLIYHKDFSFNAQCQLKDKFFPVVLPTWNDHDYGQDEANKNYESKHEAKTAFLKFAKEMDPNKKLQNKWEEISKKSDRGIYYYYDLNVCGFKIRICMFDTRWYRDNIDILGKEQKSWFENEIMSTLDDNNIDWLLLCSSCVFGFKASGTILKQRENERWDKESLVWLSNQLKNNNFNHRTLLLSGDIHCSVVHRYGYTYELTSSSLTHSISTPLAATENIFEKGKKETSIINVNSFGFIKLYHNKFAFAAIDKKCNQYIPLERKLPTLQEIKANNNNNNNNENKNEINIGIASDVENFDKKMKKKQEEELKESKKEQKEQEKEEEEILLLQQQEKKENRKEEEKQQKEQSRRSTLLPPSQSRQSTLLPVSQSRQSTLLQASQSRSVIDDRNEVPLTYDKTTTPTTATSPTSKSQRQKSITAMTVAGERITTPTMNDNEITSPEEEKNERENNNIAGANFYYQHHDASNNKTQLHQLNSHSRSHSQIPPLQMKNRDSIYNENRNNINENNQTNNDSDDDDDNNVFVNYDDNISVSRTNSHDLQSSPIENNYNIQAGIVHPANIYKQQNQQLLYTNNDNNIYIKPNVITDQILYPKSSQTTSISRIDSQEQINVEKNSIPFTKKVAAATIGIKQRKMNIINDSSN